MILSGIIVVAFGLALIAFAVLVTVKRQRAEQFIDLFARTARAHFAEQISRVIVGTALVIFSPTMWHSSVFKVFGWLLVVSSAALLLMPWRWHQRFGETARPLIVRYLTIYAVGAFALGVFILYGASRYISLLREE